MALPCPFCGQKIEEDYNLCPFCQKDIPKCSNCGKPVSPDLEICPYCKAQIHEAADDKTNSNISLDGVISREGINIDQSQQHVHYGGSDPSAKRMATREGENCPICGEVVKDKYFKCVRCGRNYLCTGHRVETPDYYKEHRFVCVDCYDEIVKEYELEKLRLNERRMQEEYELPQKIADSAYLLYKLKGHEGRVRGVRIYPGGRYIASVAIDKKIIIWDMIGGKISRTIESNVGDESIDLSYDGNLIAAGASDGSVKLLDSSNGVLIKNMVGHTGPVPALCFVKTNPHILASGSQDSSIVLWHTITGKSFNILIGHTQQVQSLDFHPRGIKLASGAYDNTVKIWDISNGTLINTLIGHAHFVPSVTYSPDGAILASGSKDKTIKLWYGEDGSFIRTLHGHNSTVYSLCVT